MSTREQETSATEKGVVKIRPVFGDPLSEDEREWPRVFVLLPIKEPFLGIFDRHILPVVDSFGVTCRHSADFFTTQTIVNEIWSAIYYADLCIADCTERNANVFYEIGIAHTLGRRTILITQSMDDIPFDLRHWRVIPYEAWGMEKFESDLRETLRHELATFLSPQEVDATLLRAIEKYVGKQTRQKTADDYQKRLEAFMDWRLQQAPAPIATQVQLYARHLEAQGYQARTIHAYVGTIRGMMDVASGIDREIAQDLFEVTRIKLPEIPEDTPKPRLSREQARTLIDAPGTGTLKGLRDTCILALIGEAGLRGSEVARLNWGQLKDYGSNKVVRVGKRQLGLSYWLSNCLAEWALHANLDTLAPGMPVFCRLTTSGSVMEGQKSISPSLVSRMVQTYAEAVGLPSTTVDVLRGSLT